MLVLAVLGMGIYSGCLQQSEWQTRNEQVKARLIGHGLLVRSVVKKSADSECNLPEGHVYYVKYGCKDLVSYCDDLFCCNSEKCLAVDGFLPSSKLPIPKE